MTVLCFSLNSSGTSVRLDIETVVTQNGNTLTDRILGRFYKSILYRGRNATNIKVDRPPFFTGN